MKLKVCGMREDVNIWELVSIEPDFVGFIFYEKSPRAVGDPSLGVEIPQNIQRVGVFVNPTEQEVLEKVAAFHLDLVQLHGDEPVEMVKKLKARGLRIMKVFSITDELPLDSMILYEPFVDFFLFDTKTPGYGGSGKQFDWEMLKQYNLNKPFFLSGGIDLEDVDPIRALNLSRLYAIDVNSRFENRPGFKDIEKLKRLKNKLRQAV